MVEVEQGDVLKFDVAQSRMESGSPISGSVELAADFPDVVCCPSSALVDFLLLLKTASRRQADERIVVDH